MSKLIDFDAVATIRSLADIQVLPGYVATIDASTAKPQDILDEYHFRELVKCGIEDCRQPHFHGLVILTIAGDLTNIGHDCGRKHFGDEFEVLRNRRTAEFRQERELAYLIHRHAVATRIKARLERPGERGATISWMCDSLREFERILPQEVMRRILNQARLNDPRITLIVERSEDEIQNQLAINPSAKRGQLRYASVLLGSLKGMRCLFPDPRLELFRLNVQIDALLGAGDLATLSYKERSALAKQTHDMESRYEQLQDALLAAQDFFSSDTLDLLKRSEPVGPIAHSLRKIVFDPRRRFFTTD
jgi:hypothetical protein